MMKKLLCGLLTFTMLTLAIPAKKAHAGFMILAATQEFVWKHKYETLDTVLVIALPVTMITTGIFAVGIAGNPFNNATLIAGCITLGEDLPQKKNEMNSALTKRYPFLNNEEVVNNLSSKIISKYPQFKDQNGSALVSLTEAEIAEATAPMELSDDEALELSSLR